MSDWGVAAHSTVKAALAGPLDHESAHTWDPGDYFRRAAQGPGVGLGRRPRGRGLDDMALRNRCAACTWFGVIDDPAKPGRGRLNVAADARRVAGGAR